MLDPIEHELDPRPLARVLADPAVEIVMHAGRQDVGILRRSWQTDVTNVFDTQVAAGFLGFGNQEGYESLVRKVLNVKLRGARGSPAGTAGRSALSSSSTQPTTPGCCSSSAPRWSAGWWSAAGSLGPRGVPGGGRLERRAQRGACLRAAAPARPPGRPAARGGARLAEWREESARSADRPPSTVLPDQALIELARRTPRDRHGLEQIRGLPPQTLHRRGDTLLQAIARGRERTPPPPPPEPPPRDSRTRRVVSLAQALVRHRSMESGVAVELIATQAELASPMSALRRGEDGDHLRVAKGWRRELVGDELRELAGGPRAA